MKMRFSPAAAAALLVASLLAWPAVQAHEGHHHDDDDDDAPAAAPVVEAPRVAAATQHVEIVAVREPDALRLYVDDYASNAPLAGLRVQVQLGSHALDASEAEPGNYRIAADLLPADSAAGSPLRVLVHGRDFDESVNTELPPVPVVSVVPATAAKHNVLVIVLAAVAGLAVLIALALRRRR